VDFALEMNRYMQSYGISSYDIARASVQHKRNAAGHPCALLGDENITVQDA
jgi:acetyl-CoA acetyltransferase